MEKKPIFMVWKEENLINGTIASEVSKFELYAFLELYIEKLKKELESQWQQS